MSQTKKLEPTFTRGNVLILFSACNRPTGCDFTTKTSNTFLARFTV